MGKDFTSQEIMSVLKADGWQLDRVVGSHHHFVHPTKKGKVTIQHPRKSIPIGTLKSIEKQSGLAIH